MDDFVSFRQVWLPHFPNNLHVWRRAFPKQKVSHAHADFGARGVEQTVEEGSLAFMINSLKLRTLEDAELVHFTVQKHETTCTSS